MKKYLAMILAAVLVLGLLAGCGGSGNADETEPAGSGSFSVGYGKADVTPSTSIPLDGYQGTSSAQYRWSASTEWPFYAICTAFTDAKGNTVLLATLDMLNAFMADAMRDAISNEVHIPKENIMFHVTHNHSGPAIRIDAPEVTQYINQLTSGVLAAAKAAMEDRKPVTGMQTTYARPEGCNTERHYLLADGSYQSYGVGSVPKDQLIGHYGVSDNLLQLVKFTREGGKDVVMVNWQGHPPGTSPNTIATSNYPGVLRNYLETNMNCEAVFILGGSGNLNNNSQIAGEIRHNDYQGLAQNLGVAAMEAAANFTDRNLSDISIKERELTLATRDGGSKKVWVYAISLGDVALVTAPFEIFDDNAVAVRENSPYAMTMYASCCNGSNGYLPTPPSFDWKITYESRTTKFPEGTAETVQKELTEMLAEIATETGYQAAEKAQDYYQAAFEPKSDGVIYLVTDPGNLGNYKVVENNFCAFQLIAGAKIKNMLCNDAELTKQILAKTQVELLFNEQNVVVGIVE